jgi:hypothetical protein
MASCTYGKRKQCKVGRERAGTFTHLTESFFLSKPPPAAVGESDMVLHDTKGLSRRGQRHHALIAVTCPANFVKLRKSFCLLDFGARASECVVFIGSAQWPFVLHTPS